MTIRKRAQKQVEIAERQAKALSLRRMGLSYADIAREVGCSKAVAISDVRTAIQSLHVEDATELRKIELARYDEMLFALDEKIAAGDPLAITTALNISQRRCALLGLDAPQAIEVVPSPQEELVHLQQLLAPLLNAHAKQSDAQKVLTYHPPVTEHAG